MPIQRRRALGLFGAAALARAAQAQNLPGTLAEVARFQGQVTGVAVSPRGRVFVNSPRWDKDVEVSVAEVMPDGTLRA